MMHKLLMQTKYQNPTFFFCGILCLLVLRVMQAASVAAEEGDAPAKTFIAIKEDVHELKDGNIPLFPLTAGTVLTLGREARGFVELKDELDVSLGWIRKKNVLTISKAENFFDSFVRADPCAQNYIQRANFLLHRESAEEAADDATEAIKLEKLPGHYVVRGRAYLLAKRYRLARIDFDRAVKIDPNDAHAYYHRALLHDALDDGDHELEDYAAALRCNPKFTSVYERRGKEFYHEKLYDKAIEDFSKVIELAPWYATAHFMRGLCHCAENRHELAITDLSQAIERGLPGPLAYLNRAHQLLDLGQLDDATADVRHGLKLDPKNAWGRLISGKIWSAKSEYDRALEDYQEALRLGPSLKYRAELHDHRGRVFHKKSEFENAIEEFTRAIELVPTDAEFFVSRALSRSQLKEFDQAIADITDAIRMGRNSGQAHAIRGDLYVSKQNYAAAVADYERAIEANPKYYPTYRNFARLLATCADEKTRDGKRAVRLGTTACELTNWNNGPCMDMLAAAYAESGDFEKAIKLCEKLIEKFPARADLLSVRLELYKAKKPLRMGHDN